MNTKRTFILSFLFSLIFISIGVIYIDYFSDESRLDTALKHYNGHQYDLAFKEYLPYAKKGNSEAQFYVARMYYFGEGTRKDFKESFKWLHLSAEEGSEKAQYSLSKMYFDGDGVGKDEKQGFLWLGKAAGQGLPIAQVKLADCYIRGSGIGRDLPKGVEWLQKASRQNNPTASTHLGILYYNGIGVKQSYEDAFRFFYKAAKLKDPRAHYLIGTMYIEGKGVEKDLKKGRMWIYQAVEGDTVADIYVGFQFLSQGKNKQAKEIFEKIVLQIGFPGLLFPDSRGEGEIFIKCPTVADFENAWQVWGDKNTPCSETASTILPLQVTMRVFGQSDNPTAQQYFPVTSGAGRLLNNKDKEK